MELDETSLGAADRGPSDLQHHLDNILQRLPLLLSNVSQSSHKLVKGDLPLPLDLQFDGVQLVYEVQLYVWKAADECTA